MEYDQDYIYDLLKATEPKRSKDIIQAIELRRESEVEARLRQGVDNVDSVLLFKKKQVEDGSLLSQQPDRSTRQYNNSTVQE